MKILTARGAATGTAPGAEVDRTMTSGEACPGSRCWKSGWKGAREASPKKDGRLDRKGVEIGVALCVVGRVTDGLIA